MSLKIRKLSVSLTVSVSSSSPSPSPSPSSSSSSSSSPWAQHRALSPLLPPHLWQPHGHCPSHDHGLAAVAADDDDGGCDDHQVEVIISRNRSCALEQNMLFSATSSPAQPQPPLIFLLCIVGSFFLIAMSMLANLLLAHHADSAMQFLPDLYLPVRTFGGCIFYVSDISYFVSFSAFAQVRRLCERNGCKPGRRSCSERSANGQLMLVHVCCDDPSARRKA